MGEKVGDLYATGPWEKQKRSNLRNLSIILFYNIWGPNFFSLAKNDSDIFHFKKYWNFRKSLTFSELYLFLKLR